MSKLLICVQLCAQLSVTALFAPGSTQAAGYSIREQSVEAMGSAMAGAAAMTDGPSAQFANPASLSWIRGNRVSAAAFPIRPDIRAETRSPSSTVLGTPITGRQKVKAEESVTTGSLFFDHHLSRDLTLGLGITAPFGLAVDYPRDWAGRYYAQNAKLETLDVNPALAWRANSSLSLGIGISFQHTRTEIGTALDLGTINALPVALGGFGNAFDALGLIPGDPDSDGRLVFRGKGTGVGWNAGLLWRSGGGTRLGVAYRSDVHIGLDGHLDYDLPGGELISGGTGLFRDGKGELTLRNPGHFSVSLVHPTGLRWTLLADITWTHWSVFDNLIVRAKDDSQLDVARRVDWQDNWRYSLGLGYSASDTLNLRAGLSFDGSATREEGPFTAAAPDGNRLIATMGMSFSPDPSFGLDFAYQYMRFEDNRLDRDTILPEDSLSGNVNVRYRSSAHILGVQLRWSF